MVRQFKLLDVILDDKMLFNKHIASICIKINFRLYSIKKSKNNSSKHSYCHILIIACLYQFTIQKLCNCYNMCLCKLFNSTKQDKFNFYEINRVRSISFWRNLIFFHLFIFHLYTFKLFLFKIVNAKRPPLLANCIKLKNNINSKYSLRSADIPSVVIWRLQCCIMET